MALQGRLETQVGLFVLVAIGIFIYMGFQIGAFRFDRSNYNTYTTFFKDISGLARKADVKIAGVKVGWIEQIKLLANDEMQAEAEIMVLKDYVLHQDAYAIVRQEGLLGPKYLEIVIGDPLLCTLESGSTLGKTGVAPVSVDDLLHRVKHITSNVESVTDSLHGTVGGPEGREQLQAIFVNLQNATEKLSAFADVLNRSFTRNEDNIDALLAVGTNVRNVAQQLEEQVLPTFQDGILKISDAFDRDLDRVADRLSSTAGALEQASLEARESFSNLSCVTDKINQGKGLVGKLINEDETYKDLRIAAQGLKNYFSTINRIEVVFDAHGETMRRPAEHYRWEDSKFYFDMRIHPNEDIFYLVGAASSIKGWRSESELRREYFDRETGREIDATTLDIPDWARLLMVYNRRDVILTRNTVRLDLQFGKIFRNIAVRGGLFEGFGGVGVDIDIPFNTDKLRWVTTMELFDIIGWNRVEDRRPHFKWLNKMYVMRNIYFTFGADDFVSRHNASTFVGIGLRFSDDDIKYLLPSLGGAKGIS